jgi:hypothetical protein
MSNNCYVSDILHTYFLVLRVQNYKKKTKKGGRMQIFHFSLFTFHFFVVPLHPHFGKSGAFDDVNRLVIAWKSV